MNAHWAWLEQTAGALIVAAVLLDVFLTVLYARMGYSIGADLLARLVWKGVSAISGAFGRHRALALSFGGPVIVVMVVAFWVIVLISGAALVFHPELGRAVQSANGSTPTGFNAAIFAAGSSIVMFGSGPMQAATPVFRMIYLFNAVIGLSLLTLTLTYIVEIYNALHDRNTLALKLYLMSSKTGDAAELIAALGATGEFQTSYSMLAEMAAEITSLKESHNFYPVLFYFRFRSAYYSVSMASMIALDTSTLLSTALDERRYGWLRKSAAVIMIGESAAQLVNTLQDTFLPDSSSEAGNADENRVECWRLRYLDALRRLKEAGIEPRKDEAAGIAEYVNSRRVWDPWIRTLAPALGFDPADIDPATVGFSGAARSAQKKPA